MRTRFAHLQLNVRPENLPFYRDLMAFLGWPAVYDGEDMLGVAGTAHDSLWFVTQMKNTPTDHDGLGLNHIGIGAESQAEVDQVAAYLTERGLTPLFETPRHRPEFSHGPDQTYYQVMFESPDGILWEIVYTGPKAA
jgi:catechol 2,3-dioxygenase-like lactoylglutathione lyase family enzyme